MTNNPETLNELALFAGAGGGILGGLLCGFRTVCAVEWDAHARRCLSARQDDGCLEPFPVWDDVQTFDGKPWRGVVDIVSGGFPCQDISIAGKGDGIDGERSSMWKHMARIVDEVEPRFVFVENSPMLVGRGLARVLGDLAAMGYDARWGVVGADAAGAPHKRERIWIVAYPAAGGLQGDDQQQQVRATPSAVQILDRWRKPYWHDLPKPGYLRRLNGVAEGVERIKRTGNGQVPAVVPIVWNLLQPQDSLSKSNDQRQATASTQP